MVTIKSIMLSKQTKYGVLSTLLLITSSVFLLNSLTFSLLEQRWLTQGGYMYWMRMLLHHHALYIPLDIGLPIGMLLFTSGWYYYTLHVKITYIGSANPTPHPIPPNKQPNHRIDLIPTAAHG